jgi:hypothetical protein
VSRGLKRRRKRKSRRRKRKSRRRRRRRKKRLRLSCRVGSAERKALPAPEAPGYHPP